MVSRRLDQDIILGPRFRVQNTSICRPTMTRPGPLGNATGPDDMSLATLAGWLRTWNAIASVSLDFFSLGFLSLAGPPRWSKLWHTDTQTYPSVQDDKSYTPGPTPEQGLNVAMHRPLSSTWLRSEPIQSPWSTWRSRSLRRRPGRTTPSSRIRLSLTPWHGWPRAHPKYLETEASAFP